MSCDTLARIHGLAVFAECLAVELACNDNADVQEAVAHYRRVHDDALYKSTVYLLGRKI